MASASDSANVPPFTPLHPVERRTIPEIFFHGIDAVGSDRAVLSRTGGSWAGIAHADMLQRVAGLASALEGLELEPGDRVAILSENRPEWAVADYAALCLGLIDVPVYPTLPADQILHILRDAGVRLAFVSTAQQWKKVLSIRDQLPTLEYIVTFDDPGDTPGLTSMAALTGAPQEDDRAASVTWLRNRARTVVPDAVATLIYTSGTTGPPKGVILSHYNLAAMVAATRQHGSLPVTAGDVALSFLPLSHIFERAVDYFYWDSGVTIAYAESPGRVAANLREVRPHTMVSVPRVFEMIYGTVLNATGARRKLIDRAIRVGGALADARLEGRSAPLAARLQFPLLDRLVFRRIREATGGRVKVFISGGAPLAPEVARFFFAAGLPIHEGYGLTETSPVLTANRPGAVRLGTVGIPYPGVELRLSHEREILARSPGVMQGYWQQPEATAAVVDAEGWFHTGDIGEFDADGFLCITDRLKDIIVTTGGKNIAPQPLEARVQESPLIQHAVMIGDRRAHPVLLVEPDLAKLRAWGEAQGLDRADDPNALLRNERVHDLLRREAMNALRHAATHERPKKVAVLPEPLTVETGLLTPTLKVRRRAVERHFAPLIDSLYA